MQHEIKEDQPISHADGIKSLFKNMFKWGGYATKEEYLHGFLFELYIGFVLSIVFLISGVSVFLTAIAKYPAHTSDTTIWAAAAGVGIFWVVLFLLDIPIAIAGWSLQIRRLRSAGVQTSWIVGVCLGEIFVIAVPYFGIMLFIALIVCIWIVCFMRPTIAQHGYAYPFFEVLSKGYNTPRATYRQAAGAYAQTSQPFTGAAAPAQPQAQFPVQPYAQPFGAPNQATTQVMQQTTLETIAKRATTRAYQSVPVDKTDLEKIATAGAQAPSAVNKQPWQIVVVTNPEILTDLEKAGLDVLASDPAHAKFFENIQKRGGKLFYNAPALILVAMDTSTDAKGLESAARDVGIVIENMALAATSLGYGNCICGLAKLPFESTRSAEFKAKLRFKFGYDFGIGLLVGKSVEEPTAHGFSTEKISWVQ